MGGIVFRLAAEQEAQPVLQPVRVRDGGDERAARPEHAPNVGDDAVRIAEVLEQLTGDDHVEARLVEGQRLVEVGPARLDAELLRLGERIAVRIDAHDLVPTGVGAGQRAVTTAEVEHLPAGSADVTAEQLDSLGAGEHEPGPALQAVVLGISVTELLEAHGAETLSWAEVHSGG